MGDLTKPLPYVVTGLIDKRREIAGRIEDLQPRMRQAVADLDHIEAAIRIIKPDLDLEAIMPRAVPPPHAAFKGEAELPGSCSIHFARPQGRSPRAK
jgi:hypothetical protein